MFTIVEAKFLGPNVKQFEIEAPRIARAQRPGQFIILRLHEHGERIPLTIKASDVKKGTITIVVQGIGKTTVELNALNTGDAILDVVGPLGKPSHIDKFGTAVVIGGGVGTAIALPTARALRDAGNQVISILGARTKDLLILEDEVRAVSDEVFIMTDDGSYGEKGVVTVKLNELIAGEGAGATHVDFVLAIGPIPMMGAVAETTRDKEIPTVVSLNSIMVDGTGMCGGCRVLVGNKSRFACVDGPEFDAHDVDFAVLAQRNAMYREQEKESLDRYRGACHG
jgi:ferredoxin--NADP+ reductase